MMPDELQLARERFEGLLRLCEERRASDLHLTADRPPYLRILGSLRPVEGAPVLEAGQLETMARALMNERQQRVFEERHSLDIAHSPGGESRFRINAFRQRGLVAVAVRRLQQHLLELADWSLPESLGTLTEFSHGLVIATGPTGSGKTTTLATLLNRIARQRPCHILTVEDPVEIVLRSEVALVHQRELHTDVPDFASAVRSAMREDPDVLLIGEMRDVETMRAAITAAETGHLVFSTLHTGDAVGSLDRLVGAFPATEQDSLRQQLSMVLRAVVAQRLLPHREGPKRIPAVELLRITTAVAHLIRTGRSEQVYSHMESGTAYGMWTMEQDLARLVASGTIALDLARRNARNPEALETWLASGRNRGAMSVRGRE